MILVKSSAILSFIGAFLLNVFAISAQTKPSFQMVSSSNITVGQQAPDVEFIDTNGKACKLSDFRNKVILLDVWATWCVPCIKGMPKMDSLYRANADDVVMLAVCSADSKENFDKFVRKNGAKFACKFVFDAHGKRPSATDFRSVYGINGFPTTMVIDQNGNVGGYGFNHEEISLIIDDLKNRKGIIADSVMALQDMIDENRKGNYAEAYRKSQIFRPSLAEENDYYYTQIESLLHIDQAKAVALSRDCVVKNNADFQFLANVGDLIAQTKDLLPRTYLYGAELFDIIIRNAPEDTDFIIVYDLAGRCWYKGGNRDQAISFAAKSLNLAQSNEKPAHPETIKYLKDVLATYQENKSGSSL
ncbi:Thiol-disulfide isomerase or thioredoxin [bacterium A37T11]|nr:Thiol-disulfide isomerase or thioredoxin [bacterium A37T11]